MTTKDDPVAEQSMSDVSAPSGMVESLLGSRNTPSQSEIDFLPQFLEQTEATYLEFASKIFTPEFLEVMKARDAMLRATDWPNIGQYRDANAAVKNSPSCVFMGDSITEMWQIGDPSLFSADVVNRGISGQTSPQMLLRFMPDVVSLKPRAVHILSGVNDVAGNTGPTTFDDYTNNVIAMLTLAENAGLSIIMGNYPLFERFAWAPHLEPRPWIARMNEWIATTAKERGHILADYCSAYSNSDGSIKADVLTDGVHPNYRGYALMRPVVDGVLAGIPV